MRRSTWARLAFAGPPCGVPDVPKRCRTNRTITMTSPTRISCVTNNEAHMAMGPGSDGRSAGLHANFGVAQMMHELSEDDRSSPDGSEHRPMSAEDPRGHLAPDLDGQSFDHHERQRPQQHHERSIERSPLLWLHRSGGSSKRVSCSGPSRAFLRRLGDRVPRRGPTSIRLVLDVHVGAQRNDHPTPPATRPRRPHQVATGSAAPSTTRSAPQAAPATRGMVSTRTSAPV